MYGMMGFGSAIGAGRMLRYGTGLYGIGPFVAFLFTLLFVAFVVLAVLVLVRKTKHHVPALAAPAQDAALVIARERLARGEIDAEQYASIANALGRSHTAAPYPPQG